MLLAISAVAAERLDYYSTYKLSRQAQRARAGYAFAGGLIGCGNWRSAGLKFARESGQACSWRRFERNDMKIPEGALRMRVIRAAALLTVLLTGPVLAQQAKPPAPADPPKSPSEIQAEKSADRAYKRSLGNIPDKPPADPWGGARAIDGSSSASTAPVRR
jgi:hypothetical protein